jgi:hypothetical protein
MSALPPKADIPQRHFNVCFGPKADWRISFVMLIRDNHKNQYRSVTAARVAQ